MKSAYQDYVKGKQTLNELSKKYHKSLPTLRKYFDTYRIAIPALKITSEPINLIFDATYFSRSDGVLVFRANKENIFWQPIASETLKVIADSLEVLENRNYSFKGFVIDGRKGVINLLKSRYPSIPIQLCHFHQSQIIRRYTTNRPKTLCGKELKYLMSFLTTYTEEEFLKHFHELQYKYQEFLKERNENKQFIHRRLRSAFRSLKTNLPYLFTYKNHPQLQLSNTTNSCDGSFAHWKQKVKIHRGLRKHRREKMVNYLLQKQ